MLTADGLCTANLNVSDYGTGNNVTVSWTLPKPMNAGIFGSEYNGWVIVDIDCAPLISGDAILTYTCGGQMVVDDLIDDIAAPYWGFNVMDDYLHFEQEFNTTGNYHLVVDTLTFSYVVLADPSDGERHNLLTTIVGDSESPAIDDTFVFVKGSEDDSFGSPDAYRLYIPYQNTR